MNNTIISESIINNIYEYYRIIGNTEYVDYIKTDYYESVKGQDAFWPKMVFNISDVGDNEIFREIKRDIIQKKIPPFILLSDYNTQIDHSFIDQIGFKPIMVWEGMHLDINDIFFDKNESSLICDKAVEDSDVQNFSDVLNCALLNKSKASFEIFNEINKSESINIFTGKENTKVVSSSLSFISDNTAGLYMIATLSDYRGKGYGTQITNKAINHAREQNATNIILHATKLGKKIYSKIGFKTYCNFYIYWLMGSY